MTARTLALCFVLCLTVFLRELYLTWDAAYQLAVIIQEQRFVVFDDRLILYFMQTPVWLARRFGFEDLSVLIHAYGVLYSFVPFFTAIAAWALTRQHPHQGRVVWAGLIALAPFQYHPLSESLIALHFFLIATLILQRASETSKTIQRRRWWIILILINTAIFYCHPIAAPLFVLEGLYLVRLKQLRLAIPFFGAAAIRATLMGSHEAQKLSWDYFFGGISPWTFEAISFVTGLQIISVMLFISVKGDLSSKPKHLLYLGLLLGFSLFAIWLTSDSAALLWVQRLRILQIIVVAPFVWLLLTNTAARNAPHGPYLSHAWLGMIVLLLSMGGLRQQAIQEMSKRWRDTNSFCASHSQFFSTPSPLAHWASYFEFILDQRLREVDHLIVDSGLPCTEAWSGERFTTLSGPRPDIAKDGYFHFRSK